jgi:hypothetical protein
MKHFCYLLILIFSLLLFSCGPSSDRVYNPDDTVQAVAYEDHGVRVSFECKVNSITKYHIYATVLESNIINEDSVVSIAVSDAVIIHDLQNNKYKISDINNNSVITVIFDGKFINSQPINIPKCFEIIIK